MIHHVRPWFRIPGLNDFQAVYLTGIRVAKRGDYIVEVGCHEGRTSAFMALEIKRSGKDVVFDCIDHADHLATFKRNMAQAGLIEYVNPIQMSSQDATELYLDASIFMVFINTKDAQDDLRRWYPKVRPGGLIAGRDYVSILRDGVGPASEYAGSLVVVRESAWIVIKP